MSDERQHDENERGRRRRPHGGGRQRPGAHREGSEAALGQVTASLVHALNTTLQAVIGYSEILSDGAPLPPNVQPAAEKIRQYSQTCAALVKSLVALMRVEAAQPGPVDVGALFVEATQQRQEGLGDARVRLVVSALERPLAVMADAGRLRHALVDLMDASLRLLERHGGGELRVEAERRGADVIVRLRDDGPGYPESDRAFEPSRVRPGLDLVSLRLAVASAIIADSGGELRVTNTAEGGCVSIVLPAAEVSSTSPKPRRATAQDADDRAPAAATGRARILVIDDAPLFLMLSRRVLGTFGEILTATSAEQAIEVLDTGEIDLIITDVWMPGALDGMGLYRWLLAERPALAQRVVFSTADVVSPDLEAFLGWSGRPCIRKPFNIRQYRATVWACLKK